MNPPENDPKHEPKQPYFIGLFHNKKLPCLMAKKRPCGRAQQDANDDDSEKRFQRECLVR
jgi:hypothetical protein